MERGPKCGTQNSAVTELNEERREGENEYGIINSNCNNRKRSQRWRFDLQTICVFLCATFLLPAVSVRSSQPHEKKWYWKEKNDVLKLSANYGVPKNPGLKPHGGTKWATASQEAKDELHDAEILRAVQESIAEWEERRRIRNASRGGHSWRTKRSQPDTSDLSDVEIDEKEPTKVCYEGLGCFEEAGYIDLLPNSPEEVNTRYLMYNSRRSRGDTPLLDVAAHNVSSLWEWVGKAFNVSAPTKVIVHGFGSSCSNVWVYEMRSALMSVEDCNIICVDWENGATIPNYVRAAANTRLVGKQLAILLSGLEKNANLSLPNVHLIGFSLGAHVAGFAGSELKNLSRITGLDPAGPIFESQDRRARLDSMDAQFVDVIHSNGENLILGGLGAWQPMGDVDFYPNGGRMQKGCTNLFVGAVSDMIWSANEVYGRSLCNHRRAYKFFTDSVNAKCQFPAVSCESYDHFVEGKCFPCKNQKECSNMGYYADKFPGRGTVYLMTRDEEPFCANQYMVKIENSPAEKISGKKPITFGKLEIVLIGELDLNETFTITQKKDEKLTRGESVSKIIVPHPALQNFEKILITYTAYKGWLSSGEPSWHIDKLSLTNSYGQILSVCKENLELESEIPVLLQLQSDECEISDSENTITINHNQKDDEINHWNKTIGPHFLTEIVHIGDEILSDGPVRLKWSNISSSLIYEHVSNITHNTSRIGIGVTEYINNPWKQKVDLFDSLTNISNHLDKENSDYGEGRLLLEEKSSSNSTFDNSNVNESTVINNFTSLKTDINTKEIQEKLEKEITEPILKPRTSENSNKLKFAKSDQSPSSNPKTSNIVQKLNMTSGKRSISNHETGNEFVDMTHHGRGFKKVPEPEFKNTSGHSVIVQFLPQKLVSFLEQAERYARMAFSPFFAENSTKISFSEKNSRVRMFNLNQWNRPKRTETNSRRDTSVEESNEKKETSSIAAKVSSFPYPFLMPRQLILQSVTDQKNSKQKYIPLISKQSGIQFPDDRRK